MTTKGIEISEASRLIPSTAAGGYLEMGDIEALRGLSEICRERGFGNEQLKAEPAASAGQEST